MAVADEVREEEVMACVVSRAGFAPGDALARNLFDFANEKLAYSEPPAGSRCSIGYPGQHSKVQKGEIFPKNTIPERCRMRSICGP